MEEWEWNDEECDDVIRVGDIVEPKGDTYEYYIVGIIAYTSNDYHKINVNKIEGDYFYSGLIKLILSQWKKI